MSEENRQDKVALEDNLLPDMELPEPLRTWDVTERRYKQVIARQKQTIDRLLGEIRDKDTILRGYRADFERMKAAGI